MKLLQFSNFYIEPMMKTMRISLLPVIAFDVENCEYYDIHG